MLTAVPRSQALEWISSIQISALIFPIVGSDKFLQPFMPQYLHLQSEDIGSTYHLDYLMYQIIISIPIYISIHIIAILISISISIYIYEASTIWQIISVT